MTGTDIGRRIERLDTSDMWSAIKGCRGQITHILDTYAGWAPRQAEETIRHSIELAKDQLEPLK